MGQKQSPLREIFIFYLFVCISLTIYSYTQVDLNLTLSSNSWYQRVQQLLLQVGYFNRPISALIFGLLLFSLFGIYFWLLKQISGRKLMLSQLYPFIGVTFLLIFAYPAFSHDLFNYMFDARLVTKYGLDPHFFRALDFPADPWTRFMRWTHRFYPYGPSWLLLTLIPSYLGMSKFVATLFLFKLFFAGFHLGTIFLIKKILEKHSPETQAFGITFFALNPLVLIESLVSPHNEVVVLTLILLSLYFWLHKQVIWSVVSFFSSGLIKYISFVLLPFFFIDHIGKLRFLKLVLVLWLVGLVPFIIEREPYSWYFVPVVGLAALIPQTKWLHSLVLALSVGTLLRYIPFIYFGDYGGDTVFWQNIGLFVGLVFTLIVSQGLWKNIERISY